MPDAFGNPTEEEMRRQVGVVPNYLSAAPGWSGVIGGTRMMLGGLPANASQAEAEAFYRNSTAYNRSAGGGYLAPETFGTLNPNASAADLSAYGDTYAARQRQQNQGKGGVGDSIVNSVKFEADRFGNLVKSVANDPSRAFTGIDPLSTKANNALFGTDNQALVNQLGGATESDFNRYAQGRDATDMRGVKPISNTANYVAGFAGGVGAANGIGNLFNGAEPALQAYRGGANLNYAASGVGEAAGAGAGEVAGAALPEIVVTGTAPAAGLTAGQVAGIAGGAAGAGSALSGWANNSDPVGSLGNAQTGGNAGQLANSGGISGGAGTGGTTQGALGGASGIANQVSGVGGSATGGFGGSMGNSSLWGNLAQLGGSLFNTYQQNQGAKDASRAQIKADEAAIAEQRRQFDLARGDQMPWLQAGQGALGRLQDPQANFLTSPGYAFTRAEGTRDIGNSFAARGGALSGNALRGLTDYNAGLASNEYNNWWNQQAGLAGIGQTSAQSLGGLGQNSANNVSNLLSNQGNARASGIVDQTNATTNGINDIANWYGNWQRNRQYGGG